MYFGVSNTGCFKIHASVTHHALCQWQVFLVINSVLLTKRMNSTKNNKKERKYESNG